MSERIPRILGKIRRVWEERADTQLIYLIPRYEDETLEAWLDARIEEIEKWEPYRAFRGPKREDGGNMYVETKERHVPKEGEYYVQAYDRHHGRATGYRVKGPVTWEEHFNRSIVVPVRFTGWWVWRGQDHYWLRRMKPEEKHCYCGHDDSHAWLRKRSEHYTDEPQWLMRCSHDGCDWDEPCSTTTGDPEWIGRHHEW